MRALHPHYQAPLDAGDGTVVPDFAFADTVVATDLDEAIPPSGIFISDDTGHAHLMTPVAYPPGTFAITGHSHRMTPIASLPPPANTNAGPVARVRLAWARVRHGVKASHAEMNALWSATACLEHSHDGRGAIIYEEAPLARAAIVGRRVRAFFSFFEWDRADLLRAAWLGFFVFVVAATAGAFALQSCPTDPPNRAVDGASPR
jgi:hypothetical protein